ncbi:MULTISPECIES: quinone-dependent dihydroorotate dehydrogenase [Methylomonas]|uniref:quinone-dependent dihydroorotate dehydrogenase n=1 Tax=Methylomonas TaxID=416 RepID=UPI001231882F|nr:quinone-dependent dihydroorotate dehydrogenase [Methylomonas rhizoryzae]
MNLYPLLRPLLFALDPERAHHATLQLLETSRRLGLSRLAFPNLPDKPVEAMGLQFKNPLGLAAGLDKNGEYIDALSAVGFGFLEIGTVTPRPQPGNPKPRLFRLPEHQAIINRMGFNNLGIEHLLRQVEQCRYRGILGINIGKNADTPIEQAREDYLTGLRKSYAAASYVTINISSPNTQNLRQLQQGDEIRQLLDALKQEQTILQRQHGKYTPIAVKIAPDLTPEQVRHIADLLLAFGMDAVIATNTTIARESVAGHRLAEQAGGLSGAPLRQRATAVVAQLADALQGKLPIIAAGGILSAQDAQEKLDAGARLIQVYSGLIYRGPELVREIVCGL